MCGIALVGNLSKGYKQRVGLAQALVNNRRFCSDEPTVGLDPNQVIEIRRLIKTLGKKHTVILSSHILPEVADVCEKVVIIDRGNIVAQDTLANLQSGLGSSTTLWPVRIAGGESKALRMCRELEGVVSAESLGVRESDTADILITTRKDTDIRRVLFNTAAKAGMPILLCRYMDITLEDIFLQLTGSERDER